MRSNDEKVTVINADPSGHCWDDVLGDDERTAALGYAGPRRFRPRRALLMIDVYNKAFGERPEALQAAVTSTPTSCGSAAWEALPNFEQLLATARRVGAPVIYTVGEPAGVPWGGPTLRSRRTGPGPEDEWGNAVIEPLRPREGEAVISKPRPSGFFGTPLASLLRTRGIDALVVAGESTSGCVRATVLDAFSLGFDVAVVEEATFDRSPISHKVNLFDMHCKYATVIHVDQALELLVDAESADDAGALTAT